MSQNNNILQELNELNSTLGQLDRANLYSVPAGYFEGLIGQVLNRIKALEAASASEELNILSPTLNNISRQMPFEVPKDYFENLDSRFAMTSDKSAEEEIESISPLLGGMKKQMPFDVPAGYFESLGKSIANENKAPAKIVSIGARKWMKYVAAAVITGVIALVAFLVFDKKDLEAQPLAKFEKTLKKEIKKMSDTELSNFLEYSEAGMNGDENVSNNTNDEIKELLKDVSESELKEFIEETSDLTVEPTMLN